MRYFPTALHEKNMQIISSDLKGKVRLSKSWAQRLVRTVLNIAL